MSIDDAKRAGSREGQSQQSQRIREQGANGGLRIWAWSMLGENYIGGWARRTVYRQQDSQEWAERRETCFVIGSCVLGQIGLTWVSLCVLSTDTPSSPSIDQVEPYSSTAQVQFDEPEATGGVPILKYKAEWRAMGEEVWHFKWYDAKEGKSGRVIISFRRKGYSMLGTHSPLRSPDPCTLAAFLGRVAYHSHLLGDARCQHLPSCSCPSAAAPSLSSQNWDMVTSHVEWSSFCPLCFRTWFSSARMDETVSSTFQSRSPA